MATTPGILYKWPWETLGKSKYLLFLPLAMKAVQASVHGEPISQNIYIHILILTGLRYLMFQLWGTASRLPYISSKYRIQAKGITFEQVDHEAKWENTLILSALTFWGGHDLVPSLFANIPVWNAKGLALAVLCHIGPVEWVYYWAHRALHHHYLFNRYHSHHHSSFVTEPITSSNHPFVEVVLYLGIFALGVGPPFLVGCGSIGLIYTYSLFLDFMNAWGHCNFEFIPTWVFECFPPLKYLIYSPTFHSLHHSRVHVNFCLFMPLYDYLYGTTAKNSDSLYQSVRQGRKNLVDCVYLTHPTELLSIFHMQFGFQTFAAQPYTKEWYMWLLWPLAFLLMVIAWLFGRPFTSDRHNIDNSFESQTWVIPRFNFQYSMISEKRKIKRWIEDCILKAQQAGANVIALGLMNKDIQLDLCETSFLGSRSVTISIVTGETLAAAIIVKGMPEKTAQVFLTGAESRIGSAIANYLCMNGTQVLAMVESRAQFEYVKSKIQSQYQANIVHVSKYEAGRYCKVWVAGMQLSKKEQSFAPRGAHFHQCTVFPMTQWREDCTYGSVPALRLPKTVQNVHACEDVLPRYVVRAAYAAALVHALEGWQHNDIGQDISSSSIQDSWDAAMKHGFSPVY